MQNTLRKTVIIGLFITPFIPLLVSSAFFFPFITTKVFAWRIIVEIIFAAWLILALLDVNYRPKKSLILYAVLAFLVVVGIADLFGVAPIRSFWSNFERMEGYISLLHLGAFFLVASSIFKDVDWKRWWNTTLIASFIMVLYSLLQIAGLKTINQGGVRVDGTLGNATYLAVYMLFHFFIATLFLWRERKNMALAWVYGLLALSHLWIIYFTATRGAILGLLGGLALVAFLNIRNKEDRLVRKSSIAVLIGLVILVGGFFAIKDAEFVTQNPVLSRFSSLSFEEIKTQGRYFVWPMAFEGWKERPLLGWGQENFRYIFQGGYVPEMYRLEPWFDRAHNIFLDWLVSGGLLGLLSYFSLYGALLYLIWRGGEDMSHTEKSILTGLIAAYFFHNFFVFDNLASYILFFALLAYLHSRGANKVIWEKALSEKKVNLFVTPVVSILLVLSLYFINIKPLQGNRFLIEALKSLQTSGEMNLVHEHFKNAYRISYLGRSEVVEHAASNSFTVFSSDMSIEEKNDFFNFIREIVLEQEQDPSQEKDARYQLLAGSFFSSAGSFDEALRHLERARELIPGKQQVYVEIANVFLRQGDAQSAIETLLYIKEISPEHSSEIDEYIRQIQQVS